MKTKLGLMAVAVLALVWINTLLAQDIVFTNKYVTFTNTDGGVYTHVLLVKAKTEGIIWKEDGVGMGMVPYTKLSPETLQFLGIPVERIEQAKARAAQMASAEAKRRAEQAQVQVRAQARAGNNAGEEQEVEVIKLEASLSAGRYKKCVVRGKQMSGEVLIQMLPASVETILNNLGQQAAQIDYLKSWIENGGKALRHAKAVAHDANLANWNNPNAPTYYVKESDYASLADARDELSKLNSAYAEYTTTTRTARTVHLKSAGSYGGSPVWECAAPGRLQQQ